VLAPIELLRRRTDGMSCGTRCSRTFASLCAEGFFAPDYAEQAGCLILCIAMPGMARYDIRRESRFRRKDIPIVFASPTGSAEAIRRG